MGFAKWGYRELILFTLLALGMAAICHVVFAGWLEWPFPAFILSTAFVIVAGFIVWFFRDPNRIPAGGDLDIISPADGTVTDTTNAPANNAASTDYLTGPCHVMGIFLSVVDVHVNRSPLDGEVVFLRYKQGKFLDARHPECGKLNEQQIIGMTATRAGGARFEVRQIAGLIARRIICPLTPGATLMRGERFGMIKFGSRTEMWVDANDADVEWLVKPGDKVKGGETVIGKLTPKNRHPGA
jgi:phosphatidylserine decarboxylase